MPPQFTPADCSTCGMALIPGKSAKGLCNACYQRTYKATHAGELAEKRRQPDVKAREAAYAVAYLAAHREQANANRRAYRVTNGDNVRRWQREHYARNTQQITEKNNDYLRAHPDKRALYGKRHREAYPDKHTEYSHQRRARELAAFVAPVNWRAIWERDGGRCRICGIAVSYRRMERDHVIPLSRGGTHEPDNAQTLCMPCNRKKGAKLPHELHSTPTQAPAD